MSETFVDQATAGSSEASHGWVLETTTTGNIDLSVIVVSWNTRDLTLECLKSLQVALDGLAAEVWVVDNNSSDESLQSIRAQYPTTKVIANTENRGFAAANNQAIELATGRYLLLLNSDTIVLGDVLPLSLAYMEEHSNVGVMGCRVLNPDGTMQPTCFMDPTFLNLILKCTGLHRLSRPAFFGREHMRSWKRDTERDVPVVTGCYMIVRRRAMDQVGLLDERFFLGCEETDWCLRFRKAGWKVRFAPVGDIIHHGNASGCQLFEMRALHLADGIIGFNLKHNGPIAAWITWGLLVLFNATRALGFKILAIVRRNSKYGIAASHFSKVTMRVWSRRISCKGETR